MRVALPASAAPSRIAGLATRVVSDPGEIDDLRADWLDLLARSESNVAMLTPLWLATWWRVWGPHEGRQLRLVLIHEGDQLVGLAPFLRRRHWHRGVVPVRRLEPLGSGEQPGEQVCSDYLNVIAARGREKAVTEAFASAVVAGRLGRWDELVLPAMAGDGPMPALLTEAFVRHGIDANVAPTDSAPYAQLPDTWDAYLKPLPGKRRYYLTKSLRDYEAWAAGADQFHEAKSAAELAEGKRVLTALHGERWGAEGHTGVFGAARFLAFHEQVMPELLRAGALELTWLTVRGEPVAAEYNLVWNNKICTYQAGRRMDVPRNIRPGLVLHLYLLRRAIEAGRSEYDMLAGVSRYKLDLATANRPLVEFRAVRAGLATGARRVVESGMSWARRLRAAMQSNAAAPSSPGESTAETTALDTQPKEVP